MLATHVTSPTVEERINQLSLADRMHLLSVLALHQELQEIGVEFIGEEGILDEEYTVSLALQEHPLPDFDSRTLFKICDCLDDFCTRDIRNLMVALALQFAQS